MTTNGLTVRPAMVEPQTIEHAITHQIRELYRRELSAGVEVRSITFTARKSWTVDEGERGPVRIPVLRINSQVKLVAHHVAELAI